MSAPQLVLLSVATKEINYRDLEIANLRARLQALQAQTPSPATNPGVTIEEIGALLAPVVQTFESGFEELGNKLEAISTRPMPEPKVEATSAAAPTELAREHFLAFQNNLYHQVTKGRIADHKRLSSEAKRILRDAIDGKVEEFRQHPARLGEIVNELSQIFESLLAEVSTTDSGQPESPEHRRALQDEAVENERRQLVQQVAARVASAWGVEESKLLDLAKTALEAVDGNVENAVAYLNSRVGDLAEDFKIEFSDAAAIAEIRLALIENREPTVERKESEEELTDETEVRETIAIALGYKSFASAAHQHPAIKELVAEFLAMDDRNETQLQGLIEQHLQAGKLRRCAR